MKKMIIYTLIIFFHIIVNSYSNEIRILYKINNSVITSYDVIEEINYLISLNQIGLVIIFLIWFIDFAELTCGICNFESVSLDNSKSRWIMLDSVRSGLEGNPRCVDIIPSCITASCLRQ